LGVSGKTDADITLAGTLDAPQLTGGVHILKADFMPDKKKPEPKKKEAPKPANAKPSSPTALAMDVNVHFDKNVWYKEKQTSIEAKGNLDIRKKPYEPMVLFGTVETVRGDYIFYGRSFKIERARILFAGETEVNPSLDVQALYVEETSKTKIHLTVTGTLTQPLLNLSSEPPLEQTDIISVLVTGKPMDELGKGGSDTSSQEVAMTYAANYFAEKFRQRLQTKAQIDVLRVNMKTPEQADVTVGKNVSDRLFLSYGQAIGATGESHFQADYSMGHFWGLEGTTSTEGKYIIDLLYRIGFP
jgi:translocation and assembly module TamB